MHFDVDTNMPEVPSKVFCARACVIEVKVAVRPLQEKDYCKSQGCKAINFQPGDVQEKAEAFDTYSILDESFMHLQELEEMLGQQSQQPRQGRKCHPPHLVIHGDIERIENRL